MFFQQILSIFLFVSKTFINLLYICTKDQGVPTSSVTVSTVSAVLDIDDMPDTSDTDEVPDISDMGVTDELPLLEAAEEPSDLPVEVFLELFPVLLERDLLLLKVELIIPRIDLNSARFSSDNLSFSSSGLCA